MLFEYWKVIDTKTEFKLLLPINYYKLKNVNSGITKWVTAAEYHLLQVAQQIID